MKPIALLISPLTKSAFFSASQEIATIELAGCLGDRPVEYQSRGGMDFLLLNAAPEELGRLARLSFVQGMFECVGEGDDTQLLPLTTETGFLLHADFVSGSKYKGKTNELLTQFLINTGLQHMDAFCDETLKLLDPMCGRGTTLMWAMRYGMKAKGIEQEVNAIADMQQNLKKWCKLHRVKHQLKDGYIGKPNKNGKGRFIDFASDEVGFRAINGDSIEAGRLLKGEKFHLIVSDLPYGIQHFTTDKTRNPMAVLEDCAQGWADSLRKGGAMVLAFNRYQPKRQQLISVFENVGLKAEEFEAPHRMSESIVRDVVIFTR